MTARSPDKPLASQIEGFRNAARELGCNESEERFDAALGKVVKHKLPPDDRPVKPATKKPVSL